MSLSGESADLIRHECAALYRFVDTIVVFGSAVNDYPVYTKQSEKFFKHIEMLGTETKRFLVGFPTEIAKDLQFSHSKRQKLLTLRASWETLHEYFKPSLDADTLHLPAPLVSTLQDELNRIEELAKFEFTVFHSTEVNYLQVPSSIVKETADDIADLIGGTQFPLGLGLVGIPYSQSASFFLNCILPHEMAHFAYQEIFSVDTASAIDRALEKIEEEVGELQDEDISLALDTLEKWVEEIFCDLFAISLIGPAYCFALIELTGATLLVEQPSTTLNKFHFFKQNHPAEIARFLNHKKMLEALGWWEVIRNSQSPEVQTLSCCESRSSDLHVEGAIPNPIGEERLIRSFDEVCSWLLDYLKTRLPDREREVDDFRSQCEPIAEYLALAVVPSTIVVDGNAINPSAVTLLNSVFKFYIESLDKLIANVEGEDPTSIETRSKFAERIELWGMKAIEDCRLMTRRNPK